MAGELEFDYVFEDGFSARKAVDEAREVITGFDSHLSGGTGGGGDADAAAEKLLGELEQVVVEFGDTPELVQLKTEQFVSAGLPLPRFLAEQASSNTFWWFRVPMTLKAYPGRSFDKFQCAVEFNPASQMTLPKGAPVQESARPGAPVGRPTVVSVLPNKKLRDLAKYSGKVEVRVGANAEFEASVPAEIGKLDIDASSAVSAGMLLGPFEYAIRVRDIDHSSTGSERMFWNIAGKDFFDGADPAFVAIVKVPRSATELRVVAAMQAYHETDFLEQILGRWFSEVSKRAERWLKMGAPSHATKTWDLDRHLSG
jgi:hypothetical protein